MAKIWWSSWHGIEGSIMAEVIPLENVAPSGPVDRCATKLFARNWCQEWQDLHDRHWSWSSHWCSWELCHHKWPGLHQHEIPASTSMQTSQQSNWVEDLNVFLSSKSWINWQSLLYWGYEGRNAVIFQVDIRSWSFLVCETAKHPRKTEKWWCLDVTRPKIACLRCIVLFPL